jgi:hypothetical protein
VKDIGVAELRNKTIMLAKFATLMKIPVITTASEPKGPNGPLMPEIHQFKLYALVAPNYAAVIETFNKAQEVARQQGPPVR